MKNSTVSWTLEVRKEIADIILFGPKNYPYLCEECSMFAYDRETPRLEGCLSLFYMTIHPVSLSQDIIIVSHDYGGREVPCSDKPISHHQVRDPEKKGGLKAGEQGASVRFA